jgi:hypothetical protein
MNDTKVKQQIAEKIKSSSNILVTVSTGPSVDALSAAIGLTVMLNKLGKHATAVFSGAVPPAITFLEPEKTFESTVDSLRDFIIALDKEKADHLRYKVDGDVVKIFITPYRTTISSDDLEFSQGDYNVELVLALGVDDQDHLDSALEAHGRILHDATVATITAGSQNSDLGSLSWHDDQASSLSEMLVSLSESIKEDKPLLDSETATAFLTGIVASTDRFSNPNTTSRVMTMAAQLMAAGADQQLIAAKLQEGHEVAPTPVSGDAIPEDSSVKIEDKSEKKKSQDGGLSISHEGETLEQIAQDVAEKNQKEAAAEAESELAQQSGSDSRTTDGSSDTSDVPEQAPEPSVAQASPEEQPLLGGTLNATTEQAAEDSRRELENDQNKTILTHSYLGGSQPTMESPPINGAIEGQDDDADDVDIFANDAPTPPVDDEPKTERAETIDVPTTPINDTDASGLFAAPPVTVTPPDQTLADLDAQNRSQPSIDARTAVDQALATQTPSAEPITADVPHASYAPPATPATDAPFDLPQPPPLPDFSQLPPPPLPVELTSAYAPEQPQILGDILATDSSSTPPVTSITPPPAINTNDPGQFKIPGQ